jgi:serine/threonine-protein kinase
MVLVGVVTLLVPLFQSKLDVPVAQQLPDWHPTVVTAAPPTSKIPIVLTEDEAKSQLAQQVINDHFAVESLVGSWVPEVSAKKLGLVVAGTTFDYTAILAEYHRLLDVYPQALLLKSGDYKTFRYPDYWITVVASPFPSASGANGWCDTMGIGPSDCLAARLTHTAGSQGNTVSRNR